MILKHHSRKQRQLKSSIKKISILLKKTDSDTDSEINKIIKKIKFLVNQLNGIISNNRMKRILGTISLVIGISFANTANAQWFAYPIQDPFNLQDPSDEEIINPEFADMDNDGDLDYLSGEYMYGLGFHYQENIGTNINPDFANPVVNPFGLIAYTPTSPNFGVWQFHNLIDLDNDGDFDILSNVVKMNYLSYAMNSDFVYYENIGTAGNPQFSAPSVNPFGLTVNNNINYTTFGDIDSDGDADILGFEFDYNSYTANFRFIENIGTASLPSFAAPQLNVFGIPAGVFAYIKLEDLDSDGDLDIIFTQEDYYSTSFGYLENTGSALVPQYNPPPVMNLFGLSFSNWQGGGIPNFKDFDGDGDNDLIVGTDDDFISYFENVGVQQTVTYECINYSCVDPGTGSGTYTSLTACQTTCVTPVSWNCDATVGCIDPADGSGLYTSFSDCQTACNNVSVNDADLNSFNIYPNPVTNVLNINSGKEIIKVEITDILGKIMISENNPTNRINVEKLQSGLYSIKIIFKDESSIVQKIIK